jgi:hypothetical protein
VTSPGIDFNTELKHYRAFVGLMLKTNGLKPQKGK